uniref:Glutaredoxin-dependent peroxiredoxin n=1 Tax=Ananas comosus var. bracteatus TaxID=296719 RepID=A0A6V7PUK0_ANACO|nr:unnamed protein product [Ananas comosus var. bracteatus]
MAPIGVGDSLPDGTVAWFDEKDELQQLSVHSLAAGKKVVLFGVPGAFTPTCSMQHVPGFIQNAEELKSKGVDEILLISVNDPFVMKAWAKTYPRTNTFALLVDDLKVKVANIEEGGQFTISGADEILKALRELIRRSVRARSIELLIGISSPKDGAQ